MIYFYLYLILYLIHDKASKDLIQFGEDDKVDVIAFGSNVNTPWSSKGNKLSYLLDEINQYNLDGATSLYPAAEEAIKILSKETNDYNVSVIIMTDGEGNIGTFKDLEKAYKSINREIPIYGITFGDADLYQLQKMANLSNGKVFDGKYDLVKAFKEVRGYN